LALDPVERWHWADGENDGDELIVSSADVSEPVAVSCAHTGNSNGSMLYNKEAITAALFATVGRSPAEQSV